MDTNSNIVPSFKPRWALELLYPLYSDTRQMRDAFADSNEVALPEEMALYTPANIEALRKRVDIRFRERRTSADHQPPIVSFRTSKGGVGKTTTCANVGACAAALGYKVLMIDAAPQASLSIMYQVNTAEKGLQTLLHAAFHGATFRSIMRQVTPNGELFLIPSDNLLAQFDYLAMPHHGREHIVKNVLKQNAELLREFDLVLIDCDPGTSQINLNILIATTHLAVVVGLDGSSLKALEQLTGELEVVNKLTGQVPEYFFVANRYFPSYQHTIENLRLMKSDYGDALLPITIPEAVAFSRQVKPNKMAETMPLFFNPKEIGKAPWRSILDLTKTLLSKTNITD